MAEPFRIGLAADFNLHVPGILEPLLLPALEPYPFVELEYFDFSDPVIAGEVDRFDAVISMHQRFQDGSFSPGTRLAAVCRWGAGYDWIHVPACTAAGVLLAITPDSVRKPVAEGNVAFLLALAKKLPDMDRLVRTGHWEKKAALGAVGLSGKTVGSVGMGSIAGETFRLLGPFDLGRRLAFDPYASPEKAAALGVELVDLEPVFRESDFVMVNCLLNDATRGLVDRRLLDLMKPSAYFINAARGGIVNQADLTAVLQEGLIAGAALDVFEQEPMSPDTPIAQLDNVLLTPHGIAWTDDLYRGNTLGACANALSVLRGELPGPTVNREVAENPGFQRKLRSLAERWHALEQK